MLWTQLVEIYAKSWKLGLCLYVYRTWSAHGSSAYKQSWWYLQNFDMHLSTEMKQFINFLIRFSAFISPFPKSWQVPYDLAAKLSSVRWPFSSSFQQALRSGRACPREPRGHFQACDQPPTWTHKQSPAELCNFGQAFGSFSFSMLSSLCFIA